MSITTRPIATSIPSEHGVYRTNHRPVLVRFWEKVHKTKSCWIWTGALGGGSYGLIWLNGRNYPAHKLSWEIHFGKIPKGKLVCHNCPGGDNPSCVNPAHLFLGTHQENLHDASLKGMLSTAKDGSKNPMAKLTENDVLEIRRRYIKGNRRGPNSSYALALEFGVRQSWIRTIAYKRRWTHVD
ncbi:HNH endonuclease [Candidatus Pacearchaeota archaeon]|jgi:hypothetical protein|nr:HNH endonuclease [Candidatus Pacearchaeota archaeon]